MASQEFSVLYTHQKMKKSKTWQDGILRIRTSGNKAILFDDKGQCLESFFIKSQVNTGDNLESERYLIAVEAVKVSEKSFEDQPRKAETPAVDRSGVKPGVLPPRHLSVGLKRKFTGFQGPRQVEKKILTTEDGEKPTILPLSKQCQGTFPSKFYITSPLFSTICKKDAETNLSAGFHEDVCTDNGREHVSLSSLLSAPFLDRCEEAEKENSDQSIAMPVPPLITGRAKSSSQTAGHGAASHNIRSTAQIIALLKSKPTQGCGEQKSEVIEHLSGFQASENAASLYNKKSTFLPAFSGNPAERLVQNMQHLPSIEGTVNDEKEWNAELLLHSAEQPCGEEDAGQRCEKKANNLSQDLQDPCNTNSCFLPESTIRRMSDSQFVPPSGDILCSASPITFEENLSRYREHSVTNALEERGCEVRLQSELQPRLSSERAPGDPELSVGVTLTETGIVKEGISTHSKDCGPDEQVMEVNFNLMEAFDFNDTDNEELCERDVNKLTEGDMLSQSPGCLKGEDAAEDSVLRLHSCCEVVARSENEEVKRSMFDSENDGNECPEGMPSQLCDNSVGDTGRTAEDSANQTRIEVELLGDGHNAKEINESQLSIKKDLDGCAVLTVNGVSRIKSKSTDLLPGETECHSKNSTFVEHEILPVISASRIISAMDKRSEDDVKQLGCTKSPDADFKRFWGSKSDSMKPGSPLLALSQNPDPSYGSFQYIAEDHQKPNCVDNSLQKAEACILPIAAAQRNPRTSDCQPKSPGSRSLHEGDIIFIGEENFQKKSNAIKKSRMDQSPSALHVRSEVPPRTMSSSPSRSDLRQTQWTSWEPGKMISSVELTASLDPDSTVSPASGSEEAMGDIQEPLIHRILPSEPELSELFFTREKSSYPEECGLSRFKPTVKPRTPFVTLPATEEIPGAVYPTPSEEVQPSFSSSAVNLCNKAAVFPISAVGPEDRNYETSVFGEYTEDGQWESVRAVFPNVTSQCRQSKWLKYQNSPQCDSVTQNSDDREVSDDICAENVLGMLLGDTGESSAVNKSAPGSAPLQTAKSMLGERCANISDQDTISERKLLSPHLSQTPLAEATQKVLSHLSCHTVTGDGQDITISELSFPNVDKVKYANLPKRKVSIPTVFQSHVHYKQIFKAALTEQLNIMLFELSQRLHNALSKVDISFYTSLKDGQSESKESCVPLCSHMHPAKLVMVKKEGQNKGRLFYTCDAPKAEQCSFFKWIEDVNPAQIKSRPSVVLHDIKSIGTYLRSQKISLYEGCQLLVRKAFEIQTQQCSKFKKCMNTRSEGDCKTKLYLRLSRKEHYSLYSKDDIWVVSKTLNFDPLDTFIASSAFFGPSSNNEVELQPLKGYSPSNWRSNVFVHALLVCNASGELTSLRNMEEHFNPSTLPLIPYLLQMNFDSEKATKRVNRRKFIPPAISLKPTMMHGPVSTEVAMGLAKKMIQTFSLNPDQATSLIQIAQMMTACENIKPVEGHQIFPITIIRGVFGAGKSYLLSVVILFLVQLFESSEATAGPRQAPWKLLIASSTNIAVDRILLGLLDLGFEDFIRVGSIRKITKAILPHSLHAGSGNENEQLKELLALMKEDLTPAEKMYVRKSIEQHKLGTNKTTLQQVKVVGATCAACPFPCLNTLKFPVVMLDECSQMTEPASLLPIARFQCEKLVLVGDPKQLPPTIQGSDSVHEKGLEQTLFDRLCLMGHKTILLRTQYRCHPAISAIANELFYEGDLIDGVSEKDRGPLLDWLPTLCFYSVNGVEQMERDNSFYNTAEAHFTVKLIQSLIASGIEGSAIGVITLYKSQMCKIQNLLGGMHSEAFEIKAVQVSTVDAFQGAEKEIIVLSCVRTRQIGFIDSEKRMNVALTRAKRHLLIVGNLACLSRNRLWGRVIHHCKGWENGLQHVSQCEQQLNDILKRYLEKRKEEEQNKKKEKKNAPTL
ncbi:5'-3' DNA helicase ZGRF1 isoform X4 [Phalacrocorax aristotelis]|uniref:5'-3' DNA helicase ZGRF1 isoform X4 n=1 Tax=Phalacrocorax aristotelis TaxID=126867 RepID=UPI003F4C9B87